MDNNNDPNKKDDKNGRQTRRGLMICAFVALFMIIWGRIISNSIEKSTQTEISYDEFVKMLENNEVKSVEIYSDTQKIVITPKEQHYLNYVETMYTGILEDGNALQERLEAAASNISARQVLRRRKSCPRYLILCSCSAA